MTHSTHVAPSAMSLVLSPLSGSRWRMVFQISSSESISLSLVIFCLAFRAIPTYPCSFDVATTAPRIPVYGSDDRSFLSLLAGRGSLRRGCAAFNEGHDPAQDTDQQR